MKYEKGMYRAILVVSIIAFILGFILYMWSIYYPTDNDFPFALLTGCVFFAVVWISFFAVLWIIKGFRDDENKK